jgi:hypothetical protein
LIIFLSITILLIPLPTKDDNRDWQKHEALPPSNTHLIHTALIGNIALEFIWLPGYYLLISKPWLFYFLLIFHLPWFIHLPPEDTLTKQHSDSNNNYTNESQPLNQQTTPATINGPYSLYVRTKYQRNVPNNDVDISDHIPILAMPKLGKQHKHYESDYKRHLLLPQQHNNDMEIPGSFTPSAQT